MNFIDVLNYTQVFFVGMLLLSSVYVLKIFSSSDKQDQKISHPAGVLMLGVLGILHIVTLLKKTYPLISPEEQLSVLLPASVAAFIIIVLVIAYRRVWLRIK